MRQISDYTDHWVKDKSDARIYEHETLFAFRNDMGNYAFNDWWCSEGFELYKQYCNNNLEDLNKRYGF